MPASKHRRRDKPRYRLNRKIMAGVLSSPVAQVLLHTAALIEERARQLYGDRELTEKEFDWVVDQLDAENGIRPPPSPD